MLLPAKESTGGKEILSSRPALTDDGHFNWQVLNDTTDYMADHFYLRGNFITAWAALNAKIFSTSVEEQVTLGRGDWLFYSSTMDDYHGRSMSEQELYCAVHNLAMMQEYADSAGVRFVFTVAPNKNSLYPSFMREEGKHESSSLVALVPELRSAGVCYADLFAAFREEPVLYYETDSHWNEKGAALGADTILAALGRKTDFYSGDFSAFTEHRGDLYEMLYPTGKMTETAPAYAGPLHYEVQGDPNGGNAMRIRTVNSAASDKLFCWRDSFGISLYPYLAESFGETMFSRSTDYDLTVAEAEGYNVFILELVERNLSQLATKAPILPAPGRELTPDKTLSETVPYSIDTKKAAGEDLCCVCGELPDGYDPCTPVYLKTPAGYVEASLTTADGQTCFSAWVGENESKIEAILVSMGGNLSAYPAVCH